MHPSDPTTEIYRSLGAALELFYTSESQPERDFWRAKVKVLLNAISEDPNESITLEEFTAQWFEAEFGDRFRQPL